MRVGEFQLGLVSDGSIWMDGGAMFGVIPKVLWEKKTAPDEQNRVRLGLNCLLVQGGGKTVLIDTGCGGKYPEKIRKIYAIEDTGLVGELARLDVLPGDVDLVINTHYHFDHCGGNTRLVGKEIHPTFPNATYVVSAQEFEAANNPDERSSASYFPDNWRPLEAAGLLERVTSEEEIVPGIRLVHTPGHTAGHHSVRIESGGEVCFYLADLCPTVAHIGLPWIMAFDLFPMTTLETRKRIYPKAVEEDWLLFFEHDPEFQIGRLHREEGKYRLEAKRWGDPTD